MSDIPTMAVTAYTDAAFCDNLKVAALGIYAHHPNEFVQHANVVYQGVDDANIAELMAVLDTIEHLCLVHDASGDGEELWLTVVTDSTYAATHPDAVEKVKLLTAHLQAAYSYAIKQVLVVQESRDTKNLRIVHSLAKYALNENRDSFTLQCSGCGKTKSSRSTACISCRENECYTVPLYNAMPYSISTIEAKVKIKTKTYEYDKNALVYTKKKRLTEVDVQVGDSAHYSTSSITMNPDEDPNVLALENVANFMAEHLNQSVVFKPSEAVVRSPLIHHQPTYPMDSIKDALEGRVVVLMHEEPNFEACDDYLNSMTTGMDSGDAQRLKDLFLIVQLPKPYGSRNADSIFAEYMLKLPKLLARFD